MYAEDGEKIRLRPYSAVQSLKVWQQGRDGSANCHPFPHCQISQLLRSPMGWIPWFCRLDLAYGLGVEHPCHKPLPSTYSDISIFHCGYAFRLGPSNFWTAWSCILYRLQKQEPHAMRVTDLGTAPAPPPPLCGLPRDPLSCAQCRQPTSPLSWPHALWAVQQPLHHAQPGSLTLPATSSMQAAPSPEAQTA